MKTSLFHFSAESFLSFHKSVHILWRRDLKDIELSTTNHHPKMRQFSSSQNFPKDVVKVLMHPWVKVIPSGTFSKRDLPVVPFRNVTVCERYNLDLQKVKVTAASRLGMILLLVKKTIGLCFDNYW
jgi:hypothetical protein